MRRGYSLPLVLLVLSTLSLAIVSLVVVVTASSKTTGVMVGRRKALYACDGVIRGLSVKARDYFATVPVPDSDSLRTFLCGSPAPTCTAIDNWFPGFTVEAVTLSTGAINSIGSIANGPFAGQSARRTDMNIRVELLHQSGRRCRVSQNMANGQIGLFQFAIFSAIPADVVNGVEMRVSGRTHINGNFCGNGNANLVFDRITVSGVLRAGSCSFTGLGNSTQMKVKDGPNGTGSEVAVNATNDGASAGWAANALTTFGGNALDVTHAVPTLKLPVSTSNFVQPGANQGGASVANADTLRLMLDPPRTTDSADIRAERMAEKADIRIINGIWYLNNGTFPGTVIWHDHHVAYPAANQLAHENDTSNNLKLLTSATVPAAPAARGYSYYERTAGGDIDVASNTGMRSVVSYGALTLQAGQHVPGIGAAANTHGTYVTAASTGFRDTRNAMDGAGAPGLTLPLNFDVAAFVERLGDPLNPANELRAVFAARGTPFNGIVWITSTWSGVHTGYGSSTTGPSSAPGPGLSPRALCGSGVGVAPCVGGGVTDVPYSAVRVVNASAIDPGVLPRGLTIATNLPVYALGDVNTSSLVAGVPGTPRAADPAGTWVPVLLAGDAFSMLSTSWNDQNRGAAALNACNTAAAETHVVAAILAGHVQSTTSWSGGLNNFPRFLECWTGVRSLITGSMVIGFRSVFARDRYQLPPSVYSVPERIWGFDPNFANPTHQPPGSPSFFVQAVERWDRD